MTVPFRPAQEPIGGYSQRSEWARDCRAAIGRDLAIRRDVLNIWRPDDTEVRICLDVRLDAFHATGWLKEIGTFARSEDATCFLEIGVPVFGEI